MFFVNITITCLPVGTMVDYFVITKEWEVGYVFSLTWDEYKHDLRFK